MKNVFQKITICITLLAAVQQIGTAADYDPFNPTGSLSSQSKTYEFETYQSSLRSGFLRAAESSSPYGVDFGNGCYLDYDANGFYCSCCFAELDAGGNGKHNAWCLSLEESPENGGVGETFPIGSGMPFILSICLSLAFYKYYKKKNEKNRKAEIKLS